MPELPKAFTKPVGSGDVLVTKIVEMSGLPKADN